MNRLMLPIFVFTATTLMGIAVTAVLAANMSNNQNIMLAAGAGFLAAIPVSWIISSHIAKLKGGSGLRDKED